VPGAGTANGNEESQMTTPAEITVMETDLDALAQAEGRVAVFVGEDGRLDPAARRVNRLTRGALERLVASKAFQEAKAADVLELAFPCGMAADAVLVTRLAPRADAATARKAGVNLGAAKKGKALLVAGGNRRHLEEIALGVALRAYAYQEMKTKPAEPEGAIRVMANRPEALAEALPALRALAEGVFFTRDLVNAPANVLTTTEFANRLKELEALGVKVEVLEEDELEKLGMRALLAVGQGSASPSKVVVMRWEGGAAEAAPLALVGKGVVFDTGGISIKPAQGMEEMTMDMGGAGVVAGVMKTLALRKARANVVGLVGLVENMPSGTAQRPGDVVKTMKGDTVEVINTDAEGRLVLCDVLWYAQERFNPAGVIDLATLTGAIIIALGHEKAGVFANDDALAGAFLKAAEAEGEGAWRMPLAPAYDEQLKSDIADFKNVGGRPAGAITAAQFLQRFIKEGMPWAHLDIAGVARTQKDGAHWPKGASGWGVLSLNRLIAERYEG
jgi:leucyl aminopeptidase